MVFPELWEPRRTNPQLTVICIRTPDVIPMRVPLLAVSGSLSTTALSICLWGYRQQSQLPQIYSAHCGEPTKPLFSLNLRFLRKWHWIKNQFCFVFMIVEQDTAHSLEIFSSWLIKTKLKSEGAEEQSLRPASHLWVVWSLFSVTTFLECSGVFSVCWVSY